MPLSFWTIWVILDSVLWLAAVFLTLLKYNGVQNVANAVSNSIYHYAHSLRNIVIAGSVGYKIRSDSVNNKSICPRTKHNFEHPPNPCRCGACCQGAGNPFFRRPKPVIRDKILDGQLRPDEPLTTSSGEHISYLAGTKTELWINVTNDGKTTIKRMRARVKSYPLQKKIFPISHPRPTGMSDDDWEEYKKRHQEFQERLEEQAANSLYGKPLPFSNTARGTVAYQWMGVDRQRSYKRN